METWLIEYYDEAVEREVFSLPDSLLARYIRKTELMKVYGADLGVPHTKTMGKSLFELRLKGKEGIARVFYCTIAGNSIVMLHAFVKKSQKTPRKELKIARNRLKEVKQ